MVKEQLIYENDKPIAVIIDYDEYQKYKEIIEQEQLENDALIAIADEAKNDEMLSFDDVTRDLGLNI